MGILKFLIIGAIIFLTGCASTGGMNFNDGSWSMCTFKNKEGFEVSIPMQTALPIGAAHPNGTVLKCEPIPANTPA